MDAVFFSDAAEFRAWLEENHACATEIWVGYYRKATGMPTMTWSEAVDEALCFGWIDGKRQRIDGKRHRQRFTPRRPQSTWSAVNVAKLAKLREEGRMTPAGEAAFATRRDDRSPHTYERRHEASFAAPQEATFRANAGAWDWFQAQSPSYRTMATFWVVSAKRPETRERRLSTLIDCSAAGQRVRAVEG